MRLLPLILVAAAACRSDDKNTDTATAGDQDTGSTVVDADGDGYGDAASGGDDCDDTDASVNPGAEETPYNGVDDDCDPQTPDDDLDGDGFTSVETGGTDCDDADAGVNPDATESCNGVDDDCNGLVDDATGDTWYADADGDGYGDPSESMQDCDGESGYVADATDCDDTTAAANPGAEEVCDEIDNDCDGDVDEEVTTTWYTDADGDGHGDPDAATEEACSEPAGYAASADDCDDADPAVNPDATEVCNGVDDDCDGTVDEDDAADATTWYADADGDGYGDPDSATLACDAPSGMVDNADDCDDADASLNPDTTWYIDYDGDGWGSDRYTLEQCEQPSGYVANTDDCDDTEAEVNPDATEVCNGVDDDCDGAVDDDDADLDTTTASTWYADDDGDGYGDPDAATLACEAPSGAVADDTDCDDTDASVNPAAEEGWFDGVDSDCDGEEEPDHCVDEPPASTTTVDTTCTYTPSVGGFDPQQEWWIDSFSDYSSYDGCIMTPVVGEMTDDDGDGDIDSDDTPDVVAVFRNPSSSTYKGVLRLISGDGSAVHWSTYEDSSTGTSYWPYRFAGAAIGDIDKDGTPDIVTTVTNGSYCYPAAYDNAGAIKWVNTTSIGCRSHAPAIADLEGDGDVEVVWGRLIVEGADGSTQAEGSGGRAYYSGYSNSGYHSVPVDLDGDGTLEIVAGNTVYAPDGSTLCSTGYSDGYVAVADLDLDGEGEFVVSGNGYVRVFEGDCTYVDGWSVTGSGYGGPPTIADFDGDGEPEIAVAAKYAYAVYETDGTVLWSNSDIVDASSHSTGSSVFDFDGDGQAEVVYGDEYYLWIFDGATGTALYQSSDHGSGTVNEYPVIADVDGDGKAEIVVPNDYRDDGILVIGDANDEWVSARTVWNQHAYSITNVEDDLSIPSPASPNWPDYNNFRQGAPGSFDPQGAANLYPLAWSACQDTCGADVEILVQVGNDGQVRAGADLVLALYGEDSAGNRTLLDSTPFDEPIDAGELSAPYSFTLSAADVAAYSAIYAVVDDEEASNECDESDNEAEVDVSGVCS